MIINQFVYNAMPEHIREYALDRAYVTFTGEHTDHQSFNVWNGSVLVHECKYFYDTGIFEWVTKNLS